MLNLSFFRNPRFSVASAAISLAFFALFGAIFALTQYLQFAHGYSALEAGAAMVPLAFGLVIGAGSSIKLSRGSAPPASSPPAGRPRRLLDALAWTPEMPYWPLGLWFFGAAVSIGWVMGPATDSVMGAVPEEKAGVASAMNDVARQVAGALGVAVVGSLVGSLYSSRVEDSTGALPAGKPTAASDSVGGAVAVATLRPPPPAGTGARLRARLQRRARPRPARGRRGGVRRRRPRRAAPAGAPPAGRTGAEGGAGRRGGGHGHPKRLTRLASTWEGSRGKRRATLPTRKLAAIRPTSRRRDVRACSVVQERPVQHRQRHRRRSGEVESGHVPPGLEGAKMLMLVDRESGDGFGITLFASEDAMRRGDEALNAMGAGEGSRRTSVAFYEVPVQTIT